jgi:hypothetical protein
LVNGLASQLTSRLDSPQASQDSSCWAVLVKRLLDGFVLVFVSSFVLVLMRFDSLHR